MSYLRTVVRPVEEHRIVLDGGGISGRGYWWGQPDRSHGPEKLHKEVLHGVVGTVVTLFVAFACFAAVIAPKAAVVGGLLVAVLVAICVVVYFSVRPEQKYVVKALVFDTTGRISIIENGHEVAAARELDRARYVYLQRPIDELANIVTIPMKNRGGGQFMYGYDRESGEAGYPAYAIVLDFASGERFYAGEYFDDDNARIVRTQLSNALQQVKGLRAGG